MRQRGGAEAGEAEGAEAGGAEAGQRGQRQVVQRRGEGGRGRRGGGGRGRRGMLGHACMPSWGARATWRDDRCAGASMHACFPPPPREALAELAPAAILACRSSCSRSLARCAARSAAARLARSFPRKLPRRSSANGKPMAACAGQFARQ
eukprot:353859-Chlamydomonas_euryale.AAC.2